MKERTKPIHRGSLSPARSSKNVKQRRSYLAMPSQNFLVSRNSGGMIRGTL